MAKARKKRTTLEVIEEARRDLMSDVWTEAYVSGMSPEEVYEYVRLGEDRKQPETDPDE